MSPITSSSDLSLLCRCLSENLTVRSEAFFELSDEERRKAILGVAANENLLPAFWEAAESFPDCLTKPERISLAIAHEANRRKNAQIRNAILEIALKAETKSISLAVLKGARWIFETPGQVCAWRYMIDFDILVDPDNSQATRSLLEGLGYRATRRERDFLGRKRFEGHYHLVAMRRDPEPYTVEVHRHTGWRPALLPAQAIFKSSRKVTANLCVPSASHAAFHAVVHWQVHHYGYQLGLQHVKEGLEICKFLARKDVDWAEVRVLAEKGGVARELEAATAAASELFGMPLPTSISSSEAGRRYARKIIQMRQSRLLMWRAKQWQRILRLWCDDRFAYRMMLRKGSPAAVRSGLWGLRLRRFPFILSHLVSIGLLDAAARLNRVMSLGSTR
jgi:hypothetical protein